MSAFSAALRYGFLNPREDGDAADANCRFWLSLHWARTGSLFAEKSRIWVTGLSGSWFSPKSVFPLHDGVRELIGQNVIREVGSVPPLPL